MAPYVSPASSRVMEIICIIVTTLTYIIRCYVRLKMLKFFGWDDWTMLLGQISFLGMSFAGIGITIEQDPVRYLQLLYAGTVFNAGAIVFTQASIVFFLLRVVQRRLYRFILWAIITISLLEGVAGTLVIMFQCKPVSKFWRTLEPGHCLSKQVEVWLTYLNSAIWIATGIAMIYIAISTLRKLNLSMSAKAGAAFILLLGLLSTTATIAKLPYCKFIAARPEDPASALQITKILSFIGLWTYIEPASGIVAGNLATYRPLLQRFFSAKKADGQEPELVAAPRQQRATDRLYPIDSVEFPASDPVHPGKGGSVDKAEVHYLEKKASAESNVHLGHGFPA